MTEQEQRFYKIIIEDFNLFSANPLTKESIARILAINLSAMTNAAGHEIDVTNLTVQKLCDASQEDKERMDLLEARISYLEGLNIQP